MTGMAQGGAQRTYEDGGPELPHELLHRYERRISVRVERNSRGVNWEVSYAAESVQEAMSAMREVLAELEGKYGA